MVRKVIHEIQRQIGIERGRGEYNLTFLRLLGSCDMMSCQNWG